MTSNTASDVGGGVWLGEETLSVVSADLGEGASDNSPEDVWTVGGAFASAGADASLSCDTASCTVVGARR